MKPEKLSDAIGKIDDDLISGAEKARARKRSKKKIYIGIAAAAACVCLIVTLSINSLFGRESIMTASAMQIKAPQYPQMAAYPNDQISQHGEMNYEEYSDSLDAWQEDRAKQLDQPEGYADGYEEFFAKTIPQFLSESGDINGVYSPLNVYMALCMLSELTDGESRNQIMSLLGVEDIETLRTKASAIWNSSYCDEGTVKSILANSVWLDNDIKYVEETMNRLADTYYASSYQGDMGSAEYNAMIQDWINEQTGGLLKDQVNGIEFDQETVLALASTVYFKAKWHNEFQEGETKPEVFHSPSGDIDCDFMHQSDNREYYWSEKFSAVSQYMSGSGSMYFILPDEGVSLAELLEDDSLTRFIFSGYEWQDKEYIKVNLSLPKFDVTSTIDLTEGLQALGVTDVFNLETSDFSPATKDTDVYLSQAEHSARVTIDEKGCTAAAYTVLMGAGAAAPPDEEIDFVLDRPFLFVITGANELPIFVGTVNQPVA